MSREDGRPLYEETAKVVPQEPPQSLTGKPLNYKHDPFTSMMLESGGGFTGAGANLLPHRFTDTSLVKIPIKVSDINGPAGDDDKQDTTGKKRKSGIFRKLAGKAHGGGDEFKVVPMARGDYLKYWAKGEDGKFLDSVVEPEGGRAAWVERQFEIFKDEL